MIVPTWIVYIEGSTAMFAACTGVYNLTHSVGNTGKPLQSFPHVLLVITTGAGMPSFSLLTDEI